jgi:hypothetical protein
MKTKVFTCLLFVLISIFSTNLLFAHCDTMDGPVVADAKKAFDQNNINYVLKWVKSDYEKEIIDAFNLAMIVRNLSPESKQLADKYFFETVVRLHRMGEGMSFTGIKPSGTPIDEKILAADRSIELGNLTPLMDLVPTDEQKELKERFERVISLKNFDINNVQAGREYIEAYIQFFHFAEGEGEHNPSHNEEIEKRNRIIPWVTTGLFLVTSLILGLLYFKRSKLQP